MRHRGLWIAVVSLLAPVALAAQEPAPRGGAAQPMSPLTRILEHRAELGLSAEQVTRLEAIEQRLQERIAPLQEQMREARGEMPARGMRGARGARGERGQRRAPRPMSPEQRAAARERMEETRERMDEMRPAMEELRESRQEAMEEIREVLTEDQQERVRQLMRDGRAGPRRPGGMERRGGGGG